MSNYPPGAKDDPRAPYNERTEFVNVCVSVTYHKEITVEVPYNYTEVDLNYAARDSVSSMHRFMDMDDWCEDEFEVIPE